MKLPDIPKSTNPRVPEPEYPFRHETPAQLRFNDFDMLGHLNNSIYVTLLDLGKSHYFTDVMPSRIDWKRVNIVRMFTIRDILWKKLQKCSTVVIQPLY